jgi:histidinol dehydrogenase
MQILHAGEALFESEFRRIKQRGRMSDEPRRRVSTILRDVAEHGDKALFKYTKKFDGVTLDRDRVKVQPQEVEAALVEVSHSDLKLLKTATARIKRFHQKQIIRPYMDHREKGIGLGWLVRPLDRVGIYAPGGSAAYPSTVLMSAIPAGVAGVRDIILVSPAKEGRLNPLVVAAAHLSGVTQIFKIGGAQAIAALAYGTESIPPVDKIVGPGNIYVTEAKRMVFGTVGIDMIAGPSEILIIADRRANPRCIAADLLSQAEHDVLASAILLTPSDTLAQKVLTEVKAQVQALPRKTIASESIRKFGALIITRSLDEAVEIANRFAPEHLELMVEKPDALLPFIKHAGAVFLGGYTPEAIGDYLAGPSHILPTAGTARFSSPLGVYDFVKRSSVISFSAEALQKYGAHAARFAEMEGLHAHGRSITVRSLKKS